MAERDKNRSCSPPVPGPSGTALHPMKLSGEQRREIGKGIGTHIQWRAWLRCSDVLFAWRNLEMLTCVLIAQSCVVTCV